jgi:DNA polymerase III epsilon subunit-like protein
MYLVLDTETTGVAATSRIVSICWAFYDGNAAQKALRYHIVYPEGFTIPAEAAAVHGITTARARRDGIPLINALRTLHEDITSNTPQLYVGHNVAFDKPILLNEHRRAPHPENFSALKAVCTMKIGTNVCRIPSRRGGYKWPKLEELHRHLFGRTHASAHDAKGDVSATAKCFFELRRRGHV